MIVLFSPSWYELKSLSESLVSLSLSWLLLCFLFKSFFLIAEDSIAHVQEKYKTTSSKELTISSNSCLLLQMLKLAMFKSSSTTSHKQRMGITKYFSDIVGMKKFFKAFLIVSFLIVLLTWRDIFQREVNKSHSYGLRELIFAGANFREVFFSRNN